MWGRYSAGMPTCLAFVLVLSGCSAAQGTTEARVLFVGNSRVYYHNQPAIVEALAAANGRDLTWAMYVEGGATLWSRIEDGALDSVRTGDWTAVVINEQSTWGLSRFVEGNARVPIAPVSFFEAVDSFATAAAEIGAQLLLIEHPRYRAMPVADGDRLIAGFAAAAARHPGVRVIPMESAWRVARKVAPEIDLYDDDGNHPSDVGALVAAMNIYAGLFGELPETIPDRITGPFVEQGAGIMHADSIVELVTVNSRTASALVEIVRLASERAEADVADANEVRSDDLPRLPDVQESIDPGAIAGTWEGELRVYPRFLTFPARMSLSFEGRDPSTASFRVSFGGTPSDIVYPVMPISNEDAYIQFVDPDGPNGGFIRYRLVPTADTLRGIAEFTNDSTVYGIGSVVLTRVP